MESLLQQGISAAKGGDKAKAFNLLTRAAQDPSFSEQSWLWLSSVVDTDGERLHCLENALRANPNNIHAQRGATMLRQKGIQPFSPIPPVDQSAIDLNTLIPPLEATSQFTPVVPVNVPPPVQEEKPARPLTAPPSQPGPVAGNAMKAEDLAGYIQYAILELSRKTAKETLTRDLINRRVSPDDARRIVTEAEKALKRVGAEKYKKRMRRGALFFIGGITVTCLSFFFADESGKGAVLFYGAILYGLFEFGGGLIGWMSAR